MHHASARRRPLKTVLEIAGGVLLIAATVRAAIAVDEYQKSEGNPQQRTGQIVRGITSDLNSGYHIAKGFVKRP